MSTFYKIEDSMIVTSVSRLFYKVMSKIFILGIAIFLSTLLVGCFSGTDGDCVFKSIDEQSTIINLRNAQDSLVLIGTTSEGGLYNPRTSEFYYFEGIERISITFPGSSTIFLDYDRNELVSNVLLEVDYLVDLVSNSTGAIDTDTILMKYMLGDIEDCFLYDGGDAARELTFLQIFYNGTELHRSSSGDNIITLFIDKN